MKPEMTSKERVLTALCHQETDRVPFSLWFGVNAPARRALQDHLGMTSPAQFDDFLTGFTDFRTAAPRYIGPADRNVRSADGSSVDIWGVVRRPVSYGAGTYDEISHYPLGGITDVAGLDSHQWPDPGWFDVSGLRDAILSQNVGNEYAVYVGNGNLFESSWYMRGFEQMLMDLAAEPELAWAILTRVTDFFIAYFTKVLEAADGLIDVVFTADDIGHQEGLLISLGMWESMIKPHHMRLNRLLHEYGVRVMYHSDGAVMAAVPGLIDMGVDILDPLQFDAKGMNPLELKVKYGDRLCFHGGVSVQKTLPFGTPGDVAAETADRIRVLGKNGGYILAPSHAVQAGTPPENLLAFLNASRSVYHS